MSDVSRNSLQDPPVHGRTDAEARLLSADGPLYALQADAGARLGETIAVPQLLAVVNEAMRKGRPLRRAIVAASESEDLDLRIEVVPDENGASITVEEWTTRPRGHARFGAADVAPQADFSVDSRLRITSLRPDVAERFGVALDRLPRPFTELVQLVPDRDGSMPFLDALANGDGFARQRAIVRAQDFHFSFSGEPDRDAAGEAQHYAMTILRADAPPTAGPGERFDDTLRSPLTRIISAADQIVDRSDGPLRSDYAAYAGDIATAGRHLLSIIRSMGKDGNTGGETVDLVNMSREAAAMVSGDARAKQVDIDVEDHDQPLAVTGEARGILQILVNIMGNAVRYSPEASSVAVVFDEDNRHCMVTIADQGPGIARSDQARIFEAYERLGVEGEDNAGLGLAISRRLARSMRGDITLESAPGEGARFTLKLLRA